jgi:predicted transcriptional regulator
MSFDNNTRGRTYELHSIYKELKGDISPILKLYMLLKREGIATDKIEWFVHTVNTGMYKIPEIQKQYAKIKDELEAIDYKKTMAKYQLDDMNNQMTYLNKISYSKRNEITYLKIGVQELEGYVHGLENHNQQQQQ